MSDIQQINHEGWLTKQGGMIKTWKRRWFILSGTILYYLPAPGTKEKGSIDLEDSSEISMAPECKKPNSFKIVTPGRTYFITANSHGEAEEWVKVLNAALYSVDQEDTTSDPNSFKPVKALGFSGRSVISLVRRTGDGYTIAQKRMKINLDHEDKVFLDKLQSCLKNRVVPYQNSIADIQYGDGVVTILSDYIRGNPLFPTPPLSDTLAAFYFCQIIFALGWLHKNGLYYGDFEPHNIIVDGDGFIVLTPIGLPYRNAKNTPYSSPNRKKGGPPCVNDDIYAAGAILYELLVGYAPNSTPVTFPDFIPNDTRAIILSLMKENPAQPDTLKDLPMFSSYHHLDVEMRTMTAPMKIVRSPIESLGTDAKADMSSPMSSFVQ